MDQTVATLAVLLIGFSLFSAVSLAWSHFGGSHYRDQPVARGFGLLLLLALMLLQLMHLAWLEFDRDWLGQPLYRTTLFVVAPAFFLFSQPLLQPRSHSRLTARDGLHALPLLIGLLLPAPVAMPIAFAVGAGYLFLLARQILALREARAGFTRELALVGLAFAIAVAIALLGFLHSAIPDRLFFPLYACAIGLAFLLVQTALAVRPALSVEVTETARAAYVNSTLTQIDGPAAIARLEQVLHGERAYQDAELNLASLAGRVGLSPHQLSELMNSRLGKSFSRYLREIRVAAAKTMLLEEPTASVLSVGLSVGFSAQSNFYEAFREIEGMTPGQFRKLRGSPDDAASH